MFEFLKNKHPEDKLGAESKRFYKARHPAQSNIPYLAFAQENMILCKDGSLLALFEYEGADTESTSREQADIYANLLDQTANLLNGRITLWWHQHHEKISHYPAGEYANPVSAQINSLYREYFLSGKSFKNRNYLAILYTNAGGLDKFFDKVSYYSSVGHMSTAKAIFNAAKDVLSYRSAFAFDYKQMVQSVSEFSEILGNFTGALSMFSMKPLIFSNALTYLHEIINPASDRFNVRMPNGGLLLDNLLADNHLTVGRNMLLFESGSNKKFVSAVTIKSYPRYTEPQILEQLAHVDGDVQVSHMFRLLDHVEAKKIIGEAVRHHELVAVPLFKRAMALLLKQKPDVNERDLQLMKEAADALASITNERKKWCEHNITVLCYGNTIDECRSVTQQVSNALNQTGFIAVTEVSGLLSSWAGTFPGNWHKQLRRQLVSVSNMTDLIPLTSMKTGNPVNPWLSEQSGKHQEAHTVFRTKQLVPYYFNFHHGSLGHTITIGPPGTGKTVFESLMVALYQKYQPFTFVFDKDYSCKIPILMQGGGYVDMKSGNVQFNPMRLLSDRKHRTWLAQWLEGLLTVRGDRYTTEDEKKVWHALEILAELPPETWTLSGLSSQLNPDLVERLEMWKGKGKYGYLFDNTEDTFEISDMTGLEMGHLMQNHPLAAGAVLDYVFYLLDLKLDGTRPGIINIQEFWFMLLSEKFARRLDDWSRTMRKRNVVVMLSTQSLKELNESEYQMSFVDNFPNRIFLPNGSARTHEKVYKSMFGLSDHQIQQIVTAIPQRNYYLVMPDGLSRMLEISMPKPLLAYLRADGKALACFRKHENSGKPNWRDAYYNEILAT